MSEAAQNSPDSLSLTQNFGYYGRSKSNTMALVRKLLHEEDNPDAKNITISNETAIEVRKTLNMMLGRPILDILVRYFVTTVNWIDQILYTPWFLKQYQRWWDLETISSVADIEFPVLFLRICSYASQFLPSSTYTVDSVKGVPLSKIRRSCDDIVNKLLPVCTRLDPRGSLTRVQHIAFAALGSSSLGQIHASWEALSHATRVAQQIGLHDTTVSLTSNIDELEKEMRRRTFCNLYIWDSSLSKRLDRLPFLYDDLSADIMPQMHLLPDIDIGVDAPDIFTGRVLRAQLARFWRSHSPTDCHGFDPIAAAERYESFCTDFLPTIQPVYALQPDKKWDKRLPTLPMQRQMLHIAIFEFLCWNFRPAVLQQPGQINSLPGYKQALIPHSRRASAVAALGVLEGATTLHTMMGGSHTRFAGIIVPIFEAAVPLLCLCADKTFPEDILDGRLHTVEVDPLGLGMNEVTRDKCMQAAQNALELLEALAEVSILAAVGARTLARLIGQVDSPPLFTPHGDSIETSDVLHAPEAWGCGKMEDFAMREPGALANFDCAEISPNLQVALYNFTDSFGLEDVSYLGEDSITTG
ncbi:hypothetical protein E0Z10_g9994 [Xylaria hypoxylon]|uniref:Xylanolytic transcriptional activator regulatory domain-containing protein n=1 Tax=Xylaria hypoxylon TaxID=37992 RepID=A0A4Z0YM87_9PEZI|nr:hypothetical protein E0Z10_g9994 [Xylaria hypoxylon]